MRLHQLYLISLVFVFSIFTLSAQVELDFETVTVNASDDLELVGDFYQPEDASETGNPAVLLFHMLGSNRHAYDPILPDLVDAGYVVLNVDMRGHGDTGGNQVWDLAIDDVQTWLDWLREQETVDDSRVAIMGASIGSNIALIGCAQDADCVGAIALSPGLDYFGVEPESAVMSGLAERAVLLVASHSDGYSAESVEQMFTNGRGDVSARIYRGAAHGTSLFRSNYDSISQLILSWLAEQFTFTEA